MSMGIRIVKISQSMYCMLRARSISATFLKEANVHLVFKVETWNFDKIIYSSQTFIYFFVLFNQGKVLAAYQRH